MMRCLPASGACARPAAPGARPRGSHGGWGGGRGPGGQTCPDPAEGRPATYGQGESW